MIWFVAITVVIAVAFIISLIVNYIRERKAFNEAFAFSTLDSCVITYTRINSNRELDLSYFVLGLYNSKRIIVTPEKKGYIRVLMQKHKAALAALYIANDIPVDDLIREFDIDDLRSLRMILRNANQEHGFGFEEEIFIRPRR